MMQPIRMRTAIEMRLFTSGKASSSSPVLVLKVPSESSGRQLVYRKLFPYRPHTFKNNSFQIKKSRPTPLDSLSYYDLLIK